MLKSFDFFHKKGAGENGKVANQFWVADIDAYGIPNFWYNGRNPIN